MKLPKSFSQFGATRGAGHASVSAIPGTGKRPSNGSSGQADRSRARGPREPARDKSRTTSCSPSPARSDSRERGQKDCLQLGRITDREPRRTKVNARDLAKLKTAQKKLVEKRKKLLTIRCNPRRCSFRKRNDRRDRCGLRLTSRNASGHRLRPLKSAPDGCAVKREACPARMMHIVVHIPAEASAKLSEGIVQPGPVTPALFAVLTAVIGGLANFNCN